MRQRLTVLTVFFAVLALVGCQPASNTSAPGQTAGNNQPDLQALSAEDRLLAEAQGYCAAESENPLGSMGTPIKLIVKDQPVFICCKGCEEKVLADPDATLAKVAELKAKVAAGRAPAR
jgi:hypothetical protein